MGQTDSKESESGSGVRTKMETRTQLGEIRGGGFSGRSLTTSPPRWKTVEFYVYYAVFLIALPMMFKAAYDVSKGEFVDLRSCLASFPVLVGGGSLRLLR